jgi:hypothetical protein
MESTFLQRNYLDLQRASSSSALIALEQDLDVLLSQHADEQTMQQVAVTLADFARCHLQDALRQLLQDEPALRRVAERSYLHGNGFYKLVLAERDNLKLRLHLWMPGVDAEENIHDHRWHLASAIVTGTLKSESWGEAVSPDARSFNEYRYTARQGKLPAQLAEMGSTRLQCKQQSERTAGQCYTMAPGTLHRIVNSGNTLTSTLMCQSAPARAWNRLLPFRAALLPEVAQPFLRIEALRAVLVRYCDELAGLREVAA